MNKTLFLIGLVTASILLKGCHDNTDLQTNGEEYKESNWVRIGPGGGGSTFIPTFSYTSPNRFLIKCDMTGAYLTNDGGDSYSIINKPNGSQSFAFDPLDQNTIYIGSNGLNRSLDGGNTWQRIFPPEKDIKEEIFRGDHANYRMVMNAESEFSDIGNHAVRNIKVDPNHPNHVYFSINSYFFYSIDRGLSWSRLEIDETIEYIYTDTNQLKNKVLVFSPNGLSVIDKNTWEYSFSAYPHQMSSAFSFTGGIVKASNQTVFYALQNNLENKTIGEASPTSIWISRDLGSVWEQVKDPVIINTKVSVPTYSRISTAENDAAHVYVVTSDHQDIKEDGSVAHWYGTLKSDDAGNNWHWVWKGGGGSGQYAVKDGIDASNLTDTWVREAFGGEFIRLIDVGVAPNNGEIAIITDWYRTMKTMDGGVSWVEVYSEQQPDGSYTTRGLDVTTAYGVHFDPFDSEHIAISYTDIGYHHSFNGGKSWIRSSNGIPPKWHNTCYWMVFDPDVKDKVWSVWSGLHDFPRGKMTRNPKWKDYGMGGVALSNDGGKTWQPTVEGMGFDSPSTSIVLDKNSPVDKRTLYVSVYGKGVFKSIDDGKSWELRNDGITGSLAAFELTLLPDGTLFLITSPIPQHTNGKAGREVHMGAVYKSTDGAGTWERLSIGDRVQFPNGLAFDPDNPNILYLGAWADIQRSDLIGGRLAGETGGNETFDLDGGIFRSKDKGNTWEQIFNTDHYVYDVTPDPTHPGGIYCNTFDRGAYYSDDYGASWRKIKGYDFHWGQRAVVDKNDPEKIFLVTYGASVWHGKPQLGQTIEDL